MIEQAVKKLSIADNLIAMLEDPDAVAKQVEGKQEYKDLDQLSNSELKMFWKSPKHYKLYKEEEIEESSSGFALGTMFEEYLLEPEKFRANYVLCEHESPSNAYHQNYAACRIDGMSMMSAYKETYSTKNKSESQMKKKAQELEDQWGEFIKFKIENKEKQEYDLSTSKLLSDMKSSVATHMLANDLLLTPPSNEQHDFVQLALASQDDRYPFKGVLDKLRVDFQTKTIYVIDVKTTSDLLSTFGYTAKKYRYHRQITIYGMLALLFIRNYWGHPKLMEILVDEDFSLELLLIATTTSGVTETRVFKVPEIASDEASSETFDLLLDFQWHKKHDVWDHTKQYYENNGIEPLDYEPEEISTIF